MNASTLFLLLLVSSAHLCFNALSKVCTNMQRDYFQSHTFRYELLSSNNETLKQEMFASHYHHLTPTDDSAWFSLFPRKMLREEDERDWAMLYKRIKNSDGTNGVEGSLKEISLHDVRLDPDSMHGQAQKTNLDYLLMLEDDRLVWSFRKTAGLETVGEPYGGWEAPDVELRGHFVGHYLSASAHMWASTHNEVLRQKMNSIVSILSTCQEKLGTGYLSAFPSELFDRFEAYEPVWAPYYTIHKIMAGLLDQYTLAGNEQALKMTVSMAEYFYNRVQNVIKKYTIERHWLSLNEETGGMNDVLYKLYGITGDQKHLTLAHLFDKPCFLGPLALKDDTISGFHSNTHIPVVIGAQMRYEVTGDPLYKEIGAFFMDTVNSSHSYATGGTSASEFWSDPKRLATVLDKENEESCTTYNMLKVSRHLFRWTKEMAYADYYERALTNGVLSIQRGKEPGKMIYMLPLGRGISKAKTYHGWGTQNDSFWCCYGTGIESFSKLGDSIYFEEEGNVPSLYVIQYIPSTVTWRSGHLSLQQQVDRVVSWDPYLRATFTITSKEKSASGGTCTINFRIPLWTSSKGAKASLNGQDMALTSPGNFLSVSRTWIAGDKITFELPINLRLEAIKDDRPEYSSLHAIFYGPYLLAGLSYGDWDIKASPSTPFSDYLTPIPDHYNTHLITLSQQTVESVFVLTHSNQSLTMDNIPRQGTDSCACSTFRIILKEPTSSDKLSSTQDELINKLVMLEPYNFPGMLVAHNGEGKNLGLTDAAEAKGSVFRIISGLNGENGSVSLESYDDNGCFVYSGFDYQSGTRVKLSCEKAKDDGFKWGASFSLRKGLSEYHNVSFVAKGLHRDFLMVPLLSLRDENYTVYFNYMS